MQKIPLNEKFKKVIAENKVGKSTFINERYLYLKIPELNHNDNNKTTVFPLPMFL